MSARQRAPLSVYLFVGAMWALAAGLFLLGRSFPDGSPSFWNLAIFFVLAVVAERWVVTVSPSSTMSLSFTVHLAAGVMFGPVTAALIAAVGILVSDGLIERRAPLKAAFNLAQMSIAVMACSMVYYSLGGSSSIDLVRDIIPLLAAALVYPIVNNTLVCAVLGLTGRSFTQEWVESIRDIMLPYFSMAPLGALVAYTYQATPWTILYFVPLVLVIYNGFKLFVSLQHETDQALVALADSIERRDQYTYQHSQRVAALASEIAANLRLTPRDADLLVAAARVHDLGKIATDNRVLLKPSTLTDEEWRMIRAHAAEGSELVGHFSMFRKGRLLIRHHHERWDGSGYPDGLAGEVIPLGARIIAVADAYDAMTSDRPYRRALTHEVAVGELQRGAARSSTPRSSRRFLARERAARLQPAPPTAEVSTSC